jgi:acetolactate synthase-1/2/3 large subunit
MAEVATAVQFNIDIKIVVINNGEQGMITELQQAYYRVESAFQSSTIRNLLL